MPPPYSYTPWESFVQWITGGNVQLWRCPPADDVTGRHLDTTEVRASTPFRWATELVNAPLTIGTAAVPDRGSIGGIPIQRVPATGRRMVTVTENNTYLGTVRQVQVPMPAAGLWVEGYPNPYQGNGASGAWDSHVVIVCPETGEAWELIGVNADLHACLSASKWVRGELVDGHAVVAAGTQLSSVLSAPNDPNHRRGITLTNYVGKDGDKEPGTGWPTCGDVYRCSQAAHIRELARARTPQQRTFVDDAYYRGFRIYDRGGVNAVGSQTSPSWAASGVPNVRLTLGDLERVTA